MRLAGGRARMRVPGRGMTYVGTLKQRYPLLQGKGVVPSLWLRGKRLTVVQHQPPWGSPWEKKCSGCTQQAWTCCMESAVPCA